MSNISFSLSHIKILCLVHVVKEAKDQFGYGKLNIFCHTRTSCFKFYK